VPAQKKTVNFLPEDELEKTKIGRILKWILKIGRYIVVFTELIVVIVFLSRFQLDKKLAGLDEEIIKKQSVVSASSDFEKDFRFLQRQLSFISETEKKFFPASDILKETASLVPKEVAFSSLKADKQILEIEGYSLTEKGLAVLMSELEKSPYFKSVFLKTFHLKGEENPIREFRLQVELVKQEQE